MSERKKSLSQRDLEHSAALVKLHLTITQKPRSKAGFLFYKSIIDHSAGISTPVVGNGSVDGGHGSFVGGGYGVPAFSIPVKTPGLVCQGQSMKTLRISIALLKLQCEYLKGTRS